MNDRTTEISVLIPAFNEQQFIAAVLESIRQSFATLPARTYEIIVCDNNSTDRTGAIATELGARVVREPHNQISRARNTAAKNAAGKWLIFLDADTLINPELLRTTLETLDSGKVCGGGSVIRFDGKRLGFFPGLLLGIWTSLSVWFGLAAGSYLFCSREAWLETGGFDESVYAGEELFFSNRLKAWGKKRGMKFKILTGFPVVTSARKMEWYGQGQLFFLVLRLTLWPGSIRNREKCDLWYVRPPSA